jgi:glycosyltransferase involved in cell wall biosynthesis
LRIVLVAPDVLPIPPIGYGGIEKVVYDLGEEYTKKGHDVIIFAPKGSISSGKIIAYEHSDTWNYNAIEDFVLKNLPENVDIIHDHTHDSIIGVKDHSIPVVCTIHGPRGSRVKYPIFLSKKIRDFFPDQKGKFIYNGINLDDYSFSDIKKDYYLFIGRLDFNKGIHHIFTIAKNTNKKIIIAGPYFNNKIFHEEIEPKINSIDNIEYIGEVGGNQKLDLIKNARCVLFPIT